MVQKWSQSGPKMTQNGAENGRYPGQIMSQSRQIRFPGSCRMAMACDRSNPCTAWFTKKGRHVQPSFGNRRLPPAPRHDTAKIIIS